MFCLSHSSSNSSTSAGRLWKEPDSTVIPPFLHLTKVNHLCKFLPTTTGNTRKYPPSAFFGSYTCPWFWSFRDGRETTVTCCGQWATQHSKAHPTDPLQDLAWYRSTRRLCRAYVFCRGASVLFPLFALIRATRAILGALPSSRCLLKERETTMPLALYIRFLVASVMKPRNGRAMNDQDAIRWVIAVLRLV